MNRLVGGAVVLAGLGSGYPVPTGRSAGRREGIRVKFRILGPVEAWADGDEPVPLPPKPRALLTVLLVHAGRPVSRDQLMTALWPEGAPPSAPRVIRARRADAEPPAVAAIAAECAFLPLALRIAAERASARPRQKLAALAAQLTPGASPESAVQCAEGAPRARTWLPGAVLRYRRSRGTATRDAEATAAP